jgi:hypothetical protein
MVRDKLTQPHIPDWFLSERQDVVWSNMMQVLCKGKDNNIEMNCLEIGCQGCDVMALCEVRSKPLYPT